MEYSGKIIKIIGNEAIVMTKDFEVVRIKLRKKVNIGEKIYFLAKDIIMEGFNTPVNLSEFVVDSQSAIDKEFQTSEKVSYFEKKKSKKLFNAIAISASFVLIFVLMQFFTVFNKKEYTYIDVDINPSFSFTVDKSGMVDSIDLLNEDAGQFVEGLKLKRISFVDVLKSILNNYKNQLVFPEDETIVFIAAAFDGKNNYEAKEKKFLDELISLNEILEKNEVKNITIKAVIVDEKIRNEALENKISMGRYVIYQQAKSDLEISLDVVREKSIYELLEVVDIQDSDGLCALVEFDMSEQEFVLQEMPMAEATPEMEQVQDTPMAEATPEMEQVQETLMAEATPEMEQVQETPMAEAEMEQVQDTPMAEVTPEMEQVQDTPMAEVTPEMEQVQKTPVVTPKLEQPQKTPVATPKLEQPQKTPVATPKLEQAQKTPVATPIPQIFEWPSQRRPRPTPTQRPQRRPRSTPARTPIKDTIRVLEDWENGHQNKWYGPNLSVTAEWAASGDYSLRSRVNVWNKSRIIIFNICDLDFTGQKTLCAVVKEEKSKLFEGKIKARLFIRTGDNWEWTNSDFKNISSSNKTILKLDLSEVPNLGDVKSIGIEFYVSSNEKGLIDLYADYIYLE